jgi:hypothetical protein
VGEIWCWVGKDYSLSLRYSLLNRFRRLWDGFVRLLVMRGYLLICSVLGYRRYGDLGHVGYAHIL